MEFENVRDAIQFMLELSEKGSTMKTNGVDSTIDDYKEMYRETLYSMCDLLGMQDLYLDVFWFAVPEIGIFHNNDPRILS